MSSLLYGLSAGQGWVRTAGDAHLQLGERLLRAEGLGERVVHLVARIRVHGGAMIASLSLCAACRAEPVQCLCAADLLLFALMGTERGLWCAYRPGSASFGTPGSVVVGLLACS